MLELELEELPSPTLVSIAPVSRRNGHGGARGYSLLHVPLRTDIADPVARLRTIKQFVANVEDRNLAVSARELTDIRKHAPAASLARRSTTPCSHSRSPRHSRGCSAG